MALQVYAQQAVTISSNTGLYMENASIAGKGDATCGHSERAFQRDMMLSVASLVLGFESAFMRGMRRLISCCYFACQLLVSLLP